MDENTRELIAIGASVAGYCQPCLTFHVDQAKRLGIGADEIKEAMAVGKMAQKEAMAAMNKFAQSALGDSLAQSLQKRKNRLKALKIYDPAMCCPTGVCGPNIDSALVEFAGAVKTVAEHGVAVERFNLAQQPQAFAQNPKVKKHLAKLGHTELPFIYVDDELRLSGRYPTAKELFTFLGMDEKKMSVINPRIKDANAFVVLGAGDKGENAGGCCPDGGCCS